MILMVFGPDVVSGTKVLDAIHSLYFLPDNFKLILTGSENADQSFYNRVVSLVERDGLGARVQFGQQIDSPHAVITTDDGILADNVVTGDSAEALASAILNIARAKA